MTSAEHASLYKVLGDEGEVVGEARYRVSKAKLVEMYQDMLRARIFDEWMLKIHPMGRVSRFPPSTGQEAAMVGSAHALENTDWIFPTYREFPVFLARKVPLQELFNRMFANRLDVLKGHEITLYGNKDRRIVVACGAVAVMIPVAVGFAMALKYRKAREICIAYFGDGATSKGDFHEGVNFAGVFKAPIVLFCQNNQYAISLPVAKQTASESIAIKALAYGIEGIRVDGNDILAVYEATKQAAEKARRGEGPTLIEAYTYRIGPHTTADDPKAYRTDDEVKRWLPKDPIKRFRKYLENLGLWNEDKEQRFITEFKEELRRVTEEAERIEPPPPEAILEDTYSVMPWFLQEQLSEFNLGMR